jgi:hypothetical protein
MKEEIIKLEKLKIKLLEYKIYLKEPVELSINFIKKQILCMK